MISTFVPILTLEKPSPVLHYNSSSFFGLNSIYLIMNIHVDIHTMLCETGSGSKHKAYIEAISCTYLLLHSLRYDVNHTISDEFNHV